MRVQHKFSLWPRTIGTSLLATTADGTHRFRLNVHLDGPAAPLPDAAGPLSDVELELRTAHVSFDRSPKEVREFLPRHRWREDEGARGN